MSTKWEIARRKKPFLQHHYTPQIPKKVYLFPPPDQPTCVISANAVYLLCQRMWETNDTDKFNRFLATMKLIRKAIMRVGTDDEPIIHK